METSSIFCCLGLRSVWPVSAKFRLQGSTQKIQSIAFAQLRKCLIGTMGYPMCLNAILTSSYLKGHRVWLPHLLKNPCYTITDSAVTDVLRSQQMNRERTRFPNSHMGSSEIHGCDQVVLMPAVWHIRIQSSHSSQPSVLQQLFKTALLKKENGMPVKTCG